MLTEDDLMLYDWNIYHFHLSNEKELSGSSEEVYFYQRTGALLFVYNKINDNNAYFLDISKKHIFSNQNLLDIINNNWPDLLNEYIMQGISKARILTDQEKAVLRKNHLMSFYAIGENIILPPGGGFTCAGTSLSCRITTDRIIKKIQDDEFYCKQKQKQYVPKQVPEFIDFKLYLHDDKIIIKEYPSNIIIDEISLKLIF